MTAEFVFWFSILLVLVLSYREAEKRCGASEPALSEVSAGE